MNNKLLQEKLESFCKKFLDKIGIVEGGTDKTPVEISSLTTSYSCSQSRNDEFGCPPGEAAIMAEWLPAGLQHDMSSTVLNGGWPKEAGIDPAKIPDESTWVTFPKTWDGIPVYYRRGEQAFAAG